MSETTIRASIVRLSVRHERALNEAELAQALGVTSATLHRLIRAGVVEAADPAGTSFSAAAVARLDRMLRLHTDVGVNLTGAAIILDLIERLERLEAELSRQRG